MKVIYGIFLAVFLTAVAIFAFQNGDTQTVKFLNWTAEVPFPALVGGMYLLGMLTGWTVVGLLKKSWRRVTEVTDTRPSR